MRNGLQRLLKKSSEFANFIVLSSFLAQGTQPTGIQVNENALGFQIPSFSQILTFLIRAFFIIAGLAALLYLMLGALAWVTSGGNKENVDKARDKITNAIIGIILIVVVLAIIATLENVVFKKAICFGITCNVTIPTLLTPTNSGGGAGT